MVILTVAAGAVLAMEHEENGLAPRELLRLGQIATTESAEDTDEAATGAAVLDEHVAWTFDLLRGGEARITARDLATRFSPSFSTGRTPAELNDALDLLGEEYGPVRFVRYELRNDREAEAVAVSESGTAMVATLVIGDDGRLEVWGVDELPTRPRLQQWEMALAVLVAWLYLAAAYATRRMGAANEPWALLATAGALAAVVLTASDIAVLYAIGRTVPATALVGAVVLLAPRWRASRAGSLAVAAAIASAAIAAMAPFTRDAAAIANPSIWALADHASAHRALLAGSAALVAVAMALVACVAASGSAPRSQWGEPLRWATVGTTGTWAFVGLASAVDYAIGDGDLATVQLFAATMACAAAVPVIVAMRGLEASVDQPQLADLVIELDGGDGDLQGAVARSLGDPSATVLEADADGALVDQRGTAIGPDPPGRTGALTTITRGGAAIGALATDGSVAHPPDRLRATAAAAGLALEVSRLNRQVLAQLSEVEASRARIVQASDAARHKVERDLHDGAQQRLVALGIKLQRARRLAERADDEHLRALLDDAGAEVRAAIEDVRLVSRGLPPALLGERGLDAAIDALAEQAPVAVSATVDAAGLEHAAETTAYFFVAEGLTNVSKHAGASEVHVSIVADPTRIVMTVSDDGKGGAVVSDGTGLEGLKDRIEATGGGFAIESGPRGTTLTATIPRTDEPDGAR